MSESPAGKPRLLYVNGPWDHLKERTRVAYVAPLEKLLRQDFEVISVPTPCDFEAEVVRHRPDLALFHTGIESPQEPAPVIRNTEAFPKLPRLGWVLRDPFSSTRALIPGRLKKWRVDASFVSWRPSDCMTSLFSDGYYVPWWVDDDVIRDYAEPKVIPISFTGAGWFDPVLYEWRHRILTAVRDEFPIFHAPPAAAAKRGSVEFNGESYARLLNRSLFAAGCGSVNHYLTQKLFEIPGCRTCLLTQETEALKAIGFEDGVNCVFATPENVVAKLRPLFEDRPQLQRITDAGYELIRSGHTIRHRRHLIDWYNLWRAKQPGQRIVQVHPFQPLQLLDRGQPTPPYAFPHDNPFIESVQEGYRLYHGGNYDEALAHFIPAIERTSWMAEPRNGAALCFLKKKDYRKALAVLTGNVDMQIYFMNAPNMDPVDQAVLALIMLKLNASNDAAAVLRTYPEVRHPALNALRWILGNVRRDLVTHDGPFAIRRGDNSKNRETIHILPPSDFEEWTLFFMSFLKAA